MFSHELEYIFNKEYRDWYDTLMKSLNTDSEENKENKQ